MWGSDKMGNLKLGIYGASTQSGRAFLADFLDRGETVFGYARPSEHGKSFVESVTHKGGIQLNRPSEVTEESRFVRLQHQSWVGHDIGTLVQESDVILLTHPSIYQEESARVLYEAGLTEKRTPLILSPSRTLAAPYLWRVLGEGYPIISLSTCLYSSKETGPSEVLIKRRKRTMVGSIDAPVEPHKLEALEELFLQTVFNFYPATTSLGNIGAVFHPGGYVYNWEDIQRNGSRFSFYMEGIAAKPDVGRKLGEIDQTRLAIAKEIGISVFGYHQEPREEEWKEIMEELRAKEEELKGIGLDYNSTTYYIRHLRSHHLHDVISNAIVSAQHWLDYTYGVQRIPEESLSEAIKRTSTYQRLSVPQTRYVEEDIPTGLVPLEALAKMLGIDHERITEVIDLYSELTGEDKRVVGRNLEGFSDGYILDYLKGATCQPLQAPVLCEEYVE